MFASIFVLVALFVSSASAQDTEYLTATECAESFTGDKLAACTLNALLEESEAQRKLAEERAAEASAEAERVREAQAAQERKMAELERDHEATLRRAEEVARSTPTPPSDLDPAAATAPAMRIVRRGTEYAALTHRQISGLASQLCLVNTAYAVGRHVRSKGIDLSSVRIVAMKDGIPLQPDLGMTVNTGTILADLRGDDVVGMYTAFHPATDKVCFDARPDEEIILAFLVDSGDTGVIPGRGEATIYGGPKSQSVWVGYTKPGVGLTERGASGGHVVYRMD